ncbi:SMC-Scp complex subunit ScpB [Halomonas elongata]|uniref:SMC-Scp complex subunit ScpB n=2 Tax=Halomonas elongata TaxID=2746 RepID=E1V7Z7_HALED|nr:SMC-Scp complex subunit ScpB [Halomonas elongata]MBW5801377.1 SMC-Scp complex subunit ScpB [Halomonas elongata]MDL4861687.1 SMC-Scp complex subunit ScpB [Halomonas elongata]WBF18802.1 SMC-Scp complex subunit ScpB [Halomonas elongata]WPU47658.1 SMC-Scp complex subunit ScpB [Halomonas elongata DSM 2581]CBV41560.1 segregation and condensation protein ScpB [Halomonas elongata DSM 2581]
MTAMEYPEALDDILEAALLAAGEPLSLERLEALFDDHERPPRRALRESLERVEGRHERGAMELLETASGYQLRIRPRLSSWVSRLWDERPQRYSRALLETLAMIAYRQPVTRADIEEVRGVSVSGSIMRTLVDRGWVRVVGHRDVPGRPAVYATTRSFLDDFGLKTLDELPPMHELKSFGEEEIYQEDEPPPPQQDVLAQADESLEESETESGTEGEVEAESGRELEESPAATGAEQAEAPAQPEESLAGTADEDETHAGTASERTSPSFADIEARLSERARGRVDEDAAAGTESTTSETDD